MIGDAEAMPTDRGRIRLNVGGKIFETTTTTLANAGRNSLFGAMFDDSWNPTVNSHEEFFVDRNPVCFSVLLDLLRTGELHVPASLPESLLYRESLFYGLLDHVRAAKWGSFDGNRVKLAASVVGRAPSDGTAIRAAPDGGCAVAHGSMVHVYDWTMDQLPPLNLNYQRINDAGFIGADRIVIGACERIDRGDGGMGMFNSITGELLFRFHVCHENQRKSFTAGALSHNSSGRIFASCRGRSNEYGIGVWDGHTGKQTDFLYEFPGWSLGDSGRLQWLAESNSLFVATLYPRTENCYLTMLDFRQKCAAWSWSDVGAPSTLDEKLVLDAIVLEDGNSICVVNQYDDLGFMDVRMNAGSVRWSTRSRLLKAGNADERCYPKLTSHGGQLFASTNDSISVFCGSDWVLTSRLRRSHGGSVCDFSIGGNRLFVLHNEEDVFDVWETPPLRPIS